MVWGVYIGEPSTRQVGRERAAWRFDVDFFQTALKSRDLLFDNGAIDRRIRCDISLIYTSSINVYNTQNMQRLKYGNMANLYDI